MKKIRLALIVIIIALVVVVGRSHQEIATAPVVPEGAEDASIKGCYVARLAKDVYTLTVQSQTGDNISGTLRYTNFQKDSSHGSLNGTYANDLLTGDYVFDSEGMHSVRQVIFKKTADGFVQGFGPVVVEGNREHFTDMSKVTYQNSPEFRSAPCTNT